MATSKALESCQLDWSLGCFFKAEDDATSGRLSSVATKARYLSDCLGCTAGRSLLRISPWRSRLVEAMKRKRVSPCGPGVHSINRRSKEEKVSGDSQLLVTYSIL